MRGEEGGGRVLLLRVPLSLFLFFLSRRRRYVPLRLCRSSYRRCCRFSPLLVVVVRYYFLRLLFPFCLHAGVREAERNEGTRSVSAYSTRSFLSASRASSTREEKNVASKKKLSRLRRFERIFLFSKFNYFPSKSAGIYEKKRLLRSVD